MKIGNMTINKVEDVDFETKNKSRISPELTNDVLYPLLLELQINETIEITTPYNDKINERIKTKNSVFGKCKRIIMKMKKNTNKRFLFRTINFNIYIKRIPDGDCSAQINEIFKEEVGKTK